MVFEGSNDYVDVTLWPFVGESLTVEAYVKKAVKSDTLDSSIVPRVFDFGNDPAGNSGLFVLTWP